MGKLEFTMINIGIGSEEGRNYTFTEEMYQWEWTRVNSGVWGRDEAGL